MKAILATALVVVVSQTSATPMLRRVPVTPSNFVWNEGSTPAAADVDQMCIQFSTDLSGWYYTFAGPWGGDSGQAGSSGSICVPTSDSAGGAMFIGPDPNPGAGSTKLECFFPTTGQANCDISLVDGYSYSVSCTADGQSTTIGGSVDLWTTGATCPQQSGPNCINTHGNDGSQDAVDAFFQPAVNDGNNYCIFDNCGQDYFFPTGNSISCSVSGTAAG